MLRKQITPVPGRRDAGWSYLELIVALMVFVLGALALAAGFLNSSRLAEESRTNNVVLTACNNLIEQLRGVEFTEVPDEFGSGTSKEVVYCLPDGRLSYTDTQDAVAKGTIQVVEDESLITGSLTGLLEPLDLDGDGDTLGLAATEDVNVWPIVVQFNIPTPSGNRDLELQYLLSED